MPKLSIPPPHSCISAVTAAARFTACAACAAVTAVASVSRTPQFQHPSPPAPPAPPVPPLPPVPPVPPLPPIPACYICAIGIILSNNAALSSVNVASDSLKIPPPFPLRYRRHRQRLPSAPVHPPSSPFPPELYHSEEQPPGPPSPVDTGIT